MDPEYDIDDNSDCEYDDLSLPCGSHSYYDKLPVSNLSARVPYPLPELKESDQTYNFVYSATPFIQCVNPLFVGVGVNRRISNQVTSVSISWNFLPQVPAAPTGAARYQLVWDRQANGANPLYSDIYYPAASSGPYVPFAHANTDNKQRFVFLRTFVYPSPLNGGINYETGKLRLNMKSTYGSGPIPITGALFFVAASNSSTTNNITPVFSFKFHDN